jgi:hypothetical protein
MDDKIFIYTASGLYSICYVTELYTIYVHKIAIIHNIPEKGIMILATCLGLTYGIRINNIALIINYSLFLCFDTIAFSMRCYYYKSNTEQISEKSDISTLKQINSFENNNVSDKNVPFDIEQLDTNSTLK